ncbi:translation-associated GTPase [Candidatus Pacearchaeota archaeon]|nr:translation-associated GTPase [Candidatus Pacearchaeota archaeon]
MVDISGETDSEGKETKGYDPVKDVEMLEKELDLWYLGILKKVWKVFARTIQNTKGDFAKAIANQFSGLKVSEGDVKEVVLRNNLDAENPNKWGEEELFSFAHSLRHLTKPMIIAANKCDKESSKDNLENLKKAYPKIKVIGVSADFELALREASNHGLIKYVPGDNDFEVVKDLNEKQKLALDRVKDYLKEKGSTGVQEVLNGVVFDLLNYIAIFPASANNLKDSKGNVLPDCFLLREGSSALDFAFAVHTDLGKNFIKAIDAKTSRAVGKEHKLKNRDAMEIVTR